MSHVDAVPPVVLAFIHTLKAARRGAHVIVSFSSAPEAEAWRKASFMPREKADEAIKWFESLIAERVIEIER